MPATTARSTIFTCACRMSPDAFQIDDVDERVEQDLVFRAADPHEVLHAGSSAGTSSHTVSTCAVCGNMSNACTVPIA